MTNFYELADNNRADLIFTKDQLLAPLQQGMLPPPFPMVDGLEERDYYLGKVSVRRRAARTGRGHDAESDVDGTAPATRTRRGTRRPA